jgi:UDP-N-acetylmuramoyl-tripeptide--D-alanyl-D-alanine ligase
LIDAQVCSRCTTVRARIGGRPMIYKIGAPGSHMARNSLAVLLAIEAVGADIARAAMGLGAWTAPEGRGARWRVALDETGIDGAITLIDESYNANPASMSAALEVLAAAKPDDDVGRVARGRRIAFLGDMLELGPDEAAMHAGLARDASLSGVDRVHCAGPRMKALHRALPANLRGEWRASSAELAKIAKRLLDAGDVAMVKGSLGARMIHVVDAIKTLGKARPALQNEEGS